MNLIITGANGFIGHEVLTQAIAHRSITSILALSRKPLPESCTSNAKVKNILIDDFSSYNPSILAQLTDADACIWTIGAKSTNPEITRKVTLEYMMTASQTFGQLAKEQGKKFRFVFTSGILSVRDQEKSIWLYPATRRVAGQAEKALLEFSKNQDPDFEGFVMRPAAVLKKEGGVMNTVLRLLPSIGVEEVAAVLLDAAVYGGKLDTLENGEMVAKGRELLKAKGEK